MLISKVSPQGQTSVPAFIRKQLAIKSGDELRWDIEERVQGSLQIIITVPTVKTIKSLRGIAGSLYKQYGGGAKYLSSERNAWKQENQ